MAKTGPSPQPTNLKVLRGNPGRRPLPSREPKPELGAPECPDWLDGEAKAEWARITPLLEAVKCITKQERAVLSAYCAAWSRFKTATIAVQTHGLTMETPQGALRRPEVAIASEAEKSLARLGAELGLSPAARTRLTVPDDGERQDPAKKILGF